MKKRGRFLLLCCLMACMLWGCSGGQEENSETVANLQEVRIGIDGSYEPYSYVDENGNFAGLDVELAREACQRMGKKAVFTAIKWDNKDAYLANQSIDCIWSCFSMDGREDAYTWVGPYMYSRQMIAVRNDSGIDSLEDLNGATVAVMSSTKPESIFLNPEGDIPQVKEVYSMENMELVFSALQSGYVDAVAGHETVVRQYVENLSSEQYRLLDDCLLSVKVGIAFEKGSNKDLAEELSRTLEEMKDDGTLGSILEKYEISVDGGTAQ